MRSALGSRAGISERLQRYRAGIRERVRRWGYGTFNPTHNARRIQCRTPSRKRGTRPEKSLACDVLPGFLYIEQLLPNWIDSQKKLRTQPANGTFPVSLISLLHDQKRCV